MTAQIIDGDETVEVTLTVDGCERRAEIVPRTLLVQFLREQLNVTAPHIGCESGRCGACSVVLNGQTIKSCMMLAVQAEGTNIMTAQGMAEDEIGQQLQAAFKACHGLQCGFCTPGMLAAARALLLRKPEPDEEDVRQALRGNLCRCTGYQHIIAAVLEAASKGKVSQ